MCAWAQSRLEIAHFLQASPPPPLEAFAAAGGITFARIAVRD